MCAQRIALSSSFNVYFLGIPDKVCLCVGYAYIRLHTHTQKNQQKTLCGGTQLTSSSWSRSLFSERKCKRMKTLQPLWDKSPLVHVRMCVCVSSPLCLLWRHTATCLCRCRLAGASSVVLQALQNALSQKFDVSVCLWVRMNELQLLQAALLQQHAAVASGCRQHGVIQR